MAVLKFKDDLGNWHSIPAIQGASAYEQAVDGGYTGTLEDFYLALKEVNAAVQAAEDAEDSASAAAASAAQLAAGVASPAGTYADLAALNADITNVDTDRIYVTADDGKWCYYDVGTSLYVAGGVYLSVADVVLYNTAQSLTSAQQTTARNNIGADRVFDDSVNLYDLALARDGKLVPNNPASYASLQTYADAAWSGIMPVTVGTYIIKQTVRPLKHIFFSDVNNVAVCAGKATDNGATEVGGGGTYWTKIAGHCTFELLDPYSIKIVIIDASIKGMSWNIHGTDYWESHTTNDFNNLLNTIMVVSGDSLPDKYLPYGKILSAELVSEYDNQSGRVSCVRSGTALQVKTPLIGTSEYIATNFTIGGSANSGLNIESHVRFFYAEYTDLAYGSSFKLGSDDICPVHYNGSYHGGNHGEYSVWALTSATHGKTEADIGSIWASPTNVQYVIIKVPDANTIWVMSVYTGTSTAPFNISTPGTPFTHVSGATETSNIVHTPTRTQLTPGANKHTLTIRNSNGDTLSADGAISGDAVDIIETYEIIDCIEMLDVLVANVGSNTNTSYYDEALVGEVLVQIDYRFFPSSCCLVSTTLTPLRAGITLASMGVVQSGTIGSDYYVPFTDYSTIATQGKSTVSFTTDKWDSADFPPYKFYQFAASGIGFALGYCIDHGQGVPTARTASIPTNAGNINGATKKMYPFFVSPGIDIYGGSICAIAWRAPVIKENDTVMTWYRLGSDIYVEIELFTALNGMYALPGICDGMRVEIVKASDTVDVYSDIVTGGVYLIGIGSLSLRCY